MTVTAASKADRERDILDSYSLKQITRNEASKLLAELYDDHLDAQITLNMTDECNTRNRK